MITTEDFHAIVEFMSDKDVNGWVKSSGLMDLLLDLTDFSLEQAVSDN